MRTRLPAHERKSLLVAIPVNDAEKDEIDGAIKRVFDIVEPDGTDKDWEQRKVAPGALVVLQAWARGHLVPVVGAPLELMNYHVLRQSSAIPFQRREKENDSGPDGSTG